MKKKTAIYEDIDGYQVVKMFSDATVDAVSTWSKISDKIHALDELALVNKTKNKIRSEESVASIAYGLAVSAQKANMIAKYNSYKNQYKVALDQISVFEEALVSQIANYKTARNALFEDNKSYFTSNPGEAVLDDDTYTALKASFDSLMGNQKLTLTGEVVDDCRGTTYWTETDGTWARTIISALGETVPDGSIAEADLTDEQKAEVEKQTEALRIASLSDEGKQEEAEEAFIKAKTATATRYNEKLLSGMAAATVLEDLETFYQEQLVAIDKKYGTKYSCSPTEGIIETET